MSRKGRSFNDLELAGEVRNLTLKQLKRVLIGIDYKLKPLEEDPSINVQLSSVELEILQKLAGNALPRLNEHSGPDGGDIPIPIYGGKSTNGTSNKNTRHNGNKEDISTEKED